MNWCECRTGFATEDYDCITQKCLKAGCGKPREGLVPMPPEDLAQLWRDDSNRPIRDTPTGLPTRRPSSDYIPPTSSSKKPSVSRYPTKRPASSGVTPSAHYRVPNAAASGPTFRPAANPTTTAVPPPQRRASGSHNDRISRAPPTTSHHNPTAPPRRGRKAASRPFESGACTVVC